jgi:hypothetical protein
MKEHRTSKPPRPYGTRRYGPAKGSFKHTGEARAKIAAASRELWRTNRDKMLEALIKAGDARRGANTEPRHRLKFSPWQRKEWMTSKCAWCNATDDLVLDHILPVMAGGTNRKANAQTLCRPCNLWKMCYVDRPLLLAILDNKGAELQPRVPERGHSVTCETSNGAGEETSSDFLL